MGQSNLSKVRKYTLELQQQGTISEKKTQVFLKSYTYRQQEHCDVQKFIDKISMDLFLKQFINNSYPVINLPDYKLQNRTITQSVRNTIFLNQIKIYLESSIRNYTKQFQQKQFYVLARIKQLFLKGHHLSKLEKTIKEILSHVLDTDYFQIYLIEKNSLKVSLFTSQQSQFFQVLPTDLAIKNYKAHVKGQGLRQNYLQFLTDNIGSKKRQNCSNENFDYETENQFCSISLHKLQSTFCDRFQSQSLKYREVMNKIWQTMVEILRTAFNKYSCQANIQTSIFNKIKKCSCLSLSFLELNLKKMKIEKNFAFFKYIQQFRSSGKLDLFGLEHLRKVDQQQSPEYQKCFREFSTKIKSIKKEICREKNLFLSFNDEGILDFIACTQYEPAIIHQIEQRLQNNFGRALQIFQNNKKLKNLLRKASRGLVNSKRNVIDDVLNVSFEKDKKGLPKKFSITIDLHHEKMVNKIFNIHKFQQSKSTKSSSINEYNEKTPKSIKFFENDKVKQEKVEYSKIKIKKSKAKDYSNLYKAYQRQISTKQVSKKRINKII